MATSGRATGTYPGRPACTLEVNVSIHSTSGNGKRWNWSLYANGSQSFQLDAGQWSVNVDGTVINGAAPLDFRSQSRILLGSGTTGLIAHDASGFNTINFSASHAMGGIFGTAAAAGSFAADRIPKPPSAPAAPVLTNVAPTTLTCSWSAPGNNNGATVTGYQLQIATDAAFTQIVTAPTYNASTNSIPVTGLDPSTDYYFRVRAQNSAGWSSWSPTATVRTLSGAYVWNGTGWRPAALYVWNGQAWRPGEVLVWDGTAWTSAT